jgi:hypothetical protein
MADRNFALRRTQDTKIVLAALPIVAFADRRVRS